MTALDCAILWACGLIVAWLCIGALVAWLFWLREWMEEDE